MLNLVTYYKRMTLGPFAGIPAHPIPWPLTPAGGFVFYARSVGTPRLRVRHLQRHD